jgi:hypothetical protein
MPALVYRISEVLSAIVIDLPIGTNLGLFHLLWMLLSGRLLQSRGALVPALAATGLEPAAVRRAWAAFANGAWNVSGLISALQARVRHEGRWQAQAIGGYRVGRSTPWPSFDPGSKIAPPNTFCPRLAKRCRRFRLGWSPGWARSEPSRCPW